MLALAYALMFKLGIARCSGNCATAAAWAASFELTAVELDQALPFPIPPTCISGARAFKAGPALAMGPGDQPVVAFTADRNVTGAQGTSCEDISYLGTDSFLILPN